MWFLLLLWTSSLFLDFWCLLSYCFWLFFLRLLHLFLLMFSLFGRVILLLCFSLFSSSGFFFCFLYCFFLSLLIILMLPSSTPSHSSSSPSSFCKFLFSSYVSFEELIVYHFLMFSFYYFLSTNSFSLFLSSGTWYGLPMASRVRIQQKGHPEMAVESVPNSALLERTDVVFGAGVGLCLQLGYKIWKNPLSSLCVFLKKILRYVKSLKRAG